MSGKRKDLSNQIEKTVQEFIDKSRGEHHRSWAWEHCYSFFQQARDGIEIDPEPAALHLGCYLASWGMYRGSGFLYKHNFKIHERVVDVLVQPQFRELWDSDSLVFDESQFTGKVLGMTEALKKAFERIELPEREKPRKVSNTLLTKILLGTVGCVPGCDRSFIKAWTNARYTYSPKEVNQSFVLDLCAFVKQHEAVLRELQTELPRKVSQLNDLPSVKYPLMKIVDMYFNQLGDK